MEVNSLSYRELHEIEESNEKLIKPNDISLISDIEVELEVIIGKTKLTVSQLYEIKKGSVLELDSDVESPVDIVLNRSVVAKGQLVVVGDNYGIQIIESVWGSDE
ncbi:MAG: FliM/FliN family flagellar motor switch protein [Gammaproteobacteria bacterium]